MITVRADVGGGPECMWQLINDISEVDFFAVLPQEKPYWGKVAGKIGVENCFRIPHRKFSLGYFLKLARWCLDRKINVIHAHGRGAGFYGRLLELYTGVPCLTTRHGYISKPRFKDKIVEALEFLTALFASGEVACSPGEWTSLINLHGSTCGITVIKNGIREVATGDYNPDRLRFAHVTRFVEQKNSEFLFPIVRTLKSLGIEDFSIDVYGDGEGRSTFVERAKQLGIKNHFVLHGNVDDLINRLSSSTLLLSVSLWEGLPLTLLEAQASGCPVVASNVQGNRDVVESGVGGFLCPFDARQFAECIVKVCENRAAYSADAVRSVRKRFSQKTTVDSYRGIYESFSTRMVCIV